MNADASNECEGTPLPIFHIDIVGMDQFDTSEYWDSNELGEPTVDDIIRLFKDCGNKFNALDRYVKPKNIKIIISDSQGQVAKWLQI